MNQAAVRTSALRECIHTLIARQVERTPDAPAIFDLQGKLTYRELDQRANQLAHELVARGAGPDTIVGLCVDRSAAMVIGVLGILKAGGAFLPLDPAYPPERLQDMIGDSAVGLIVAREHTRTSIPHFLGTCLNIDDAALTQHPITAPALDVQPQHLAYVVYTSGSTGRPKGVMIEHGSVVSFLAWAAAEFDTAQMARVLCASSLSFDVAFFEIFAPLAVGGALVIVRDALELLTHKPTEPISTMCMVASALTELVRARAIPESVTTILQAGEYLSKNLANEIYATSHVTKLINLCGATEDTIYSVSYTVPRVSNQDPPIGRPFRDRAVYILDEHLQPVAPGTPGEICYGGTGVARGYLNRPELTAERFVDNPFGDSARMYRSGDLVVAGADGEIHYLRRNDQQVKIRGFRVELGEVEAVLREHPGVEQIAVLAHESHAGKVLVAYAVERTPGALALDDVLAFVAERLPEYMVPSSLVLLDVMPVGPSGKLDRAALPRLERRRPELALAYLAPRNAYEAQVAALIAALLGLDRVGVTDNFFALGGQSLLAARLVSELTDVFPAEVARLNQQAGDYALLTSFFVEPTVETLAAALGSAADIRVSDHTSAAGLQSTRWVQRGESSRLPIFLFHGVIRGEAFYVWNLAQGLGAEQPLYSFAPHGYGGESVPETIEEMAVDYLRQLRDIQPHGPYTLVGYCNGGLVAFEIARRLRIMGEDVAGLVLVSASAANARLAWLWQALTPLSVVPGMSESRRRSIFLSLRGRINDTTQIIRGEGTLLDRFKQLARRRYAKRSDFSARDSTPLSRHEREEFRFATLLRALDAYIPSYYDGDLTLLWGEDEAQLARDPANGWRAIVRNVRLATVPGDHHFVESHPEFLVEQLRCIGIKAQC